MFHTHRKANAGNIVAVCGIGMEIVREENEEKTADDSMQSAQTCTGVL